MKKLTKRPRMLWHEMPVSRRQFLATASSLTLAATVPTTMSYAASSSILKVRSYGDVRSLDPAFSQGVTDEEIQSMMYSKLIQFKPGNKWDWQLDAATKVEQVDATHIKFVLRDDVGFTDGFGAMTAEDVKFSFERIVDDQIESTGKPDLEPLKEVLVTSEREGVIVLKRPFQPLWSISLPYITGNIVSKKAFESVGGTISTKAVACSGPYMHKSWAAKQKTVLVRNPDWRGEKAAFDEVHMFPIDDEKTAEIAYEAGEIDFTRVSLGSVERLRSQPLDDTTLAEFPSLYYVWVGMNLENPKLKSLPLRQAIQHAIDVPSILEAAYFGIAKPSTGIIAPGLVGHRPQNLVPSSTNIAKAKALMEQSGQKNVQLTLRIINKQAYATAAQVIQANLAAIGIDLEIDLQEAASFWQSGGDDNLELVLNRYSMTPDPSYATAWFTCAQSKLWNWERFCNDEFDQIHKAAQSESDAEKRGEMYRRAQDLMEQSGAYKFLTHEATPVIYRNSIQPALRPDGLPLLRYFKRA